MSSPTRRMMVTYSSDSGVIFFSSISSSAKFFWYFSQFCPVALGIVNARPRYGAVMLWVAVSLAGNTVTYVGLDGSSVQCSGLESSRWSNQK